MKLDLTETIELPQGVTAKKEGNVLEITGPKGSNNKEFAHQRIVLEIQDNKILLSCKAATKREKTVIKTYNAHVKNMVKGSQDPHKYELKICSGHFPMNVSYSGDTFSVKNFLGEKTPRILKIPKDVKLKLAGQIVTLESPSKESAGQCAAALEQLTRITNKDRRIFQDGIYITNKAGKAIK